MVFRLLQGLVARGRAVLRPNSVNPTSVEEVRQSQLFDEAWYVDAYGDVAEFRGGAIQHYLTFGWKEARNPSPLFDTNWYLETYPDVRASNVNPLIHYIRHGAAELRDTSPEFRPSIFQDAAASRGAHHLAAATAFLRGLGASGAATGRALSADKQRVLIIAELSIPQCKKYRVDQKAELIRLLGFDCTISDWHDRKRCQTLILTHTTVIFYRVPAYPHVLELIQQAKDNGALTYWEVDDLVFDLNEYIKNNNLRSLSPELQRSVLNGVPLYRAAMLACDAGIASTPALADFMRRAGVQTVHVIENALDAETIAFAADAVKQPRPKDGLVRIVYGSGTKTHDIDFLEAAPAILKCMQAYPKLVLRIIGDLTLPEAFEDEMDRVEVFEAVAYDEYLKLMAEGDIAIAPLERSAFNEAKSNIKYIEASMLNLPSVCSRSAAFESVVQSGENGYLANSDQEWFEALSALIERAPLRARLAKKSGDLVRSKYAPRSIAEREIWPVFKQEHAERKRLRVMFANIFYAPRSFGGATIVAEQLAQRLNQSGDAEVIVFTSSPPGIGTPYELIEYSSGDIPVFAINLPETVDPVLEFDTRFTLTAFREALLFSDPDVVHIHSVQGIGARIVEVCKEEGYPVIITVHDAWWICGRQFMITGEGKYCYQRTIDLNVCAQCVNDAGLNAYREARLRSILLSADLILSPSKFFRQLYIENGVPPERIVVNRNGIQAPVAFKKAPSEKLRFGFLGGNAEAKGAHLVKRVFTEISDDDYELVLIDNTMSLGFSSVKPEDWPIKGDLRILPSFTQDNMDDFYSQIDVLLFPTQWKESFGLTVREALIRDIWVIVTDAGGVTEDVVDGENGVIIPLDDDGSSLKRAVETALARREALKSHVNPSKSSIAVYDDQARELGEIIRDVASRSCRKARPSSADGTVDALAELS